MLLICHVQKIMRIPALETCSFVRDNHSAPSSFGNLDDCIDSDSILKKKPAAVGTNAATSKLTAARSEWVNQETEEKQEEERMKQFQNAKYSLQKFSFSAEHIEQVLKQLGPTYTFLQAATLELQRRQNKSKTKEVLEHFKVEIGIMIKKPFHGTLYQGIVICKVQDKVIKSGKLVKVCHKAYEDGDSEELDYDEVHHYCICTPGPALPNI